MKFAAENWMFILLAVVAAWMLIAPAIKRRGASIHDVGIAEAVSLINHHDAVVLDVREDREVAGGVIHGARHIPLGQLQTRLVELEKFRTRPVIVNCRSGHRSLNACVLLHKQGFEKVHNLSGGITAWQQANMPLEKKR